MSTSNTRWYELTIASAGSASNSAVVWGNQERIFVIVSGVTAFNAGAGNTRVYLQGKTQSSTTWADFPGASALTEVGSARVYDFGVVPPFEIIRLGVGTATSSVATFYVGLRDHY